MQKKEIFANDTTLLQKKIKLSKQQSKMLYLQSK